MTSTLLFNLSVYGSIIIAPRIVSSLRLAATRVLLDQRSKDTTEPTLSTSTVNEILLGKIVKVEQYYMNVHYIMTRQFYVVFICVVALFVFGWDFGLISLGAFVIGFGMKTIAFNAGRRKLNAKLASSRSKVNYLLQDLINLADVVKTHNTQKSEMQALRRREVEPYDYVKKKAAYVSTLDFFYLCFISFLTPLLIIYYRFHYAPTDQNLTAFFSLLFEVMLIQTIYRALLGINYQMPQHLDAMESIKAIQVLIGKENCPDCNVFGLPINMYTNEL
eukprot:Pgem_evm1s3086